MPPVGAPRSQRGGGQNATARMPVWTQFIVSALPGRPTGGPSPPAERSPVGRGYRGRRRRCFLKLAGGVPSGCPRLRGTDYAARSGAMAALVRGPLAAGGRRRQSDGKPPWPSARRSAQRALNLSPLKRGQSRPRVGRASPVRRRHLVHWQRRGWRCMTPMASACHATSPIPHPPSLPFQLRPKPAPPRPAFAASAYLRPFPRRAYAIGRPAPHARPPAGDHRQPGRRSGALR